MMHRYGRHGPHAWKRWRLLHAQRYKRSLQPILPDVQNATIHIHVTIATIESIIIVTVNEGHIFTQILRGKIVNALLPPGVEPEASANICYLAAEDAERKALADLRALEDSLTDTELREYASNSWDEHNYAKDADVRKEAINLKTRGITPRDIYIAEFCRVYIETLAKKGATLMDSDTRAIAQQARKDKIHATQHSPALSEREQIALAAIRVHTRLGIDPLSQHEALHHHIRIYLEYYNKPYSTGEGGDNATSSQNGFRQYEKHAEE